MGYCEDAKALIGPMSLFTGVETVNWTIAQFLVAAQTCRTWGVDTLIVKCADGGNKWYGGNWKPIHDAITSEGVGCLFYAYGYGDKFGAFQAELDILKTLLADFGVACADLEAEWNGRPDLATTMAAQLKPSAGKLFVTTWANPSEQKWLTVAKALGPVVDCWLPQAYDDYLYGVMLRDYATLGCYVPVFNLTNEYGPNDVLSFVEASLAGGSVSLWEYEPAIKAMPLVAQLIKIMQQGVKPVVTPTPSPAPTPIQPPKPLTFSDDDKQVWQLIRPVTINETAAIEQSWLRARWQKGMGFGPVLENEHTIVRNGKHYTEQQFSAARASYCQETGELWWYTPNGPIQV